MGLSITAPLTHLGMQAAGDTTSDPFASVSSFFDSTAWSVILFAAQAFFILLWPALAWWTFQDARRRSHNVGFVLLAVVLAVVMPVLGVLIYLLIRPPEYLMEARERELELIALERRLGDIGDHEGQQIVGRLIAREGGGQGLGMSSAKALKEAGVASREELQDLDIRLTELEYRLRNSATATSAIDPSRPGVQGRPRAQATTPDARPTAADPDDPSRTTIRRMRRAVRPDPEASS